MQTSPGWWLMGIQKVVLNVLPKLTLFSIATPPDQRQLFKALKIALDLKLLTCPGILLKKFKKKKSFENILMNGLAIMKLNLVELRFTPSMRRQLRNGV